MILDIYLETSALLTFLFQQKGGGLVEESVDAATRVYCSTLTLLESGRAVSRAEALEQLDRFQARRLRSSLLHLAASWQILEMTDAILARAAAPFPVEPIRSLDALHVATIEELRSTVPELSVLSFDVRIGENAKAFGCELISLRTTTLK